METALIEWLRRRVPAHAQLPLGIGDDAAVVESLDAGRTVVSTDMLMDGVDFRLTEADPRRVGHKCLAVNLSDLAAMASRPTAAFVSLALPRKGGRALAEGLFEGILPLAEDFDVAVAGGDTNSWNGPLVASVTVLGSVGQNGPLMRRGARSGDRVLVTGSFGGSILGRHLDVRPRVREALRLADRYPLHAGIDVSDGLACDLDHLCTESGCGAIVDLANIPIHPDAERLAAMRADGHPPLDHALGDGEDFELVLTVPPDVARSMLTEQPIDVPLTDIGEIVAQPGLRARDTDGRVRRLEPTGYQHEFG
jgi:thiamine-monophosphate kinase